MGNPLFERNRQTPNQNKGLFGMMYDRMYQTIPEFRDFANSAKGKPIDQVFSEKGYDYNQYRKMSNDDIASFILSNMGGQGKH